MFTVTVNTDSVKILVSGLGEMIEQYPKAVQRSLTRIAMGVEPIAKGWLQGSRGNPGAYPVPVEKGELSQSQGWLAPGKTISTSEGSITAALDEAIVYNYAAYATTIHEGKGSSRKYGPRRFITDAFDEFNTGDRVSMILDEEIEKILP